MRINVKILLMLICIILAFSAIACTAQIPEKKPTEDPPSNTDTVPDEDAAPDEAPDAEPDEESPGSVISILDKNDPTRSLILYEKDLYDTAKSLNTVLASVGIDGIKMTIGDKQKAKYRIVIGDTSCASSQIAKDLYNKAKAVSHENFHWAFAYHDGDLAVYAGSDLGYEKAISDLVSRNVNLGKLVIPSDFSATGVFTQAEHQALLEQIAKEEESVSQHAPHVDSLLALLEAQREELKTYEGPVSKYDSNPETKLLFWKYSIIKNNPWGAPPINPTDEHPRLLINSSMTPEIKKSLRAGDAKAQQFENLIRKTLPNGALLKELDPSGKSSNLDYTYLEVIQAKALASLVYGDHYYGYQAIYYMKNVLKSLDIQYIASDQCRDYGYVMFTAALVYDWCYDLLTREDKIQFVAGVENCLCRGYNKSGSKIEVGFPPSYGGSVAGHSCEYVILRDYLSFAIAIYGDNNSWWNYVGGRVYNDFLPVRNYYYQSDMTPQGTGVYVTARFIGDIYSAWMLRVATGENPYVNMEKVVRSCLSYEFTPRKLFNDGDGTNDYVDAFRYMDIAYISAYLFGDTTLLAQGDFLLGSKTLSCGIHRKSYMGINNPIYMALSGLCDIQPKADRYEDLELISYNGHPFGQYLAHSAWDDPAAVSIFMRIKERTTANHEHADAGTFEIYYKGALTTDGGIYDNNSAHGLSYHKATVAHNGLLIYDPSKVKTEGEWYSGGQRIGLKASTNLDKWLADDNMKTGIVTGRQHGYIDGDRSQPQYAYIAGDITSAYDSDTVSYVGRRMLAVFTGGEEFPMVFFVFDDIESKLGYERKFLLQISSKNAPVVDADAKTVVTENGDGKLVLTCLTEGNIILKGVGGRNSGKYDANNSQNYLVNGTQVVPNDNGRDDGHWGRVEIILASPKTDITFMNVLYVTDRGNKNKASVVSVTDAVGLEGGVFEGKIAGLFASSRTGATKAISCTVEGEDSIDYYVSGVVAGEWSVTVDGKDCGTYTATAEGGLLTFTAPAGAVVITPVK